MTFVNYGVARLLIQQHGTSRKDDGQTSQSASRPVHMTDEELLQMYIRKFHQFCKRSVFEVPKHVFGKKPCDGERLAFKVTKTFIKSFHSDTQCLQSAGDTNVSGSSEMSSTTLKLSLEDTIDVQGRIADCLGLSPKNKWPFVFLGASKGCIELNFSVPAAVFAKLKSQLSIKAPSHFRTENELVKLEASGVHLLCGPPGVPNAK